MIPEILFSLRTSQDKKGAFTQDTVRVCVCVDNILLSCLSCLCLPCLGLLPCPCFVQFGFSATSLFVSAAESIHTGKVVPRTTSYFIIISLWLNAMLAGAEETYSIGGCVTRVVTKNERKEAICTWNPDFRRSPSRRPRTRKHQAGLVYSRVGRIGDPTFWRSVRNSEKSTYR